MGANPAVDAAQPDPSTTETAKTVGAEAKPKRPRKPRAAKPKPEATAETTEATGHIATPPAPAAVSSQDVADQAAPGETELPAEATAPQETEVVDTYDDVPDEPVADLLEDLRQFVLRYVILPSVWSSIVVTLWVAHTWLMEYLDTTPRLAIQSPGKRSGKTRLLEVLQATTKGGMQMVHSSVAALVRLVDRGSVTVLLDEVDQLVGAHGGMAAEMLAIVNAGYRRGATVPRCTGDSASGVTVEQLNAFGPVALAGIDNYPWPDTMMDRAIVLRMERRRETDEVQPWRYRMVADEVRTLTRRLAAMAYRHGEKLPFDPKMPPGIVDRDADVWDPLVAIAELAGGHWPDWVAAATAEHLERRSDQEDDAISLSERLLVDVRRAFEQRGADRLSTTDLLLDLCADQEAPWGALRGHRLDARGLAFRLRRYGVGSKDIRIGQSVVKGYLRADFRRVWELYAPELEAADAEATQARAAGPKHPVPLPPPPRDWSKAAAQRWESTQPGAGATTLVPAPEGPLTVGGVEIPAGATQQWARWLLRDAGVGKLATDEETAVSELPQGPPVFLGVVLDDTATENEVHAAMEARELAIKDLHAEDFAALDARFPVDLDEAAEF